MSTCCTPFSQDERSNSQKTTQIKIRAAKVFIVCALKLYVRYGFVFGPLLLIFHLCHQFVLTKRKPYCSMCVASFFSVRINTTTVHTKTLWQHVIAYKQTHRIESTLVVGAWLFSFSFVCVQRKSNNKTEKQSNSIKKYAGSSCLCAIRTIHNVRLYMCPCA